MKSKNWIKKFTKLGAFWIHDGNPKKPHALLTSGNHSNGFFNGGFIIEDPKLLAEVCKEIIGKLDLLFFKPDRVFGSAVGACDISYELGRQLGCKRGFTEPTLKKEMILKRFKIEPGELILVVEDVITTGDTTLKTIDALKLAGAHVSPQIAVIVNRSGKSFLGNFKITALIDKEMPIWAPEECPLCKQGSEAIRPKENWDKLTKKY